VKIAELLSIGSVEWNRSKIMLVGQGRAGKSCLIKSFLGEPFVENNPSTAGIDNDISCSLTVAALNNNNSKLEIIENEVISNELSFAVARLKRQNDELHQEDDCMDVDDIHATDNSNNYDVAENPTFIVKMDENELEMAKSHGNVELPSGLIVSIFDYGGQRVFDIVHHLFLTKYGVYCVVFSMSSLIDPLTGVLRDSSDPVYLESIASLRIWVNSILIHTYNHDDKENACACAPIAFVGTHKDVIDKSSSHQIISEQLGALFKDVPIWKNVVFYKEQQFKYRFFPVSNVDGLKDPCIQHLIREINNTLSNSSHVKKKIPLVWLQIYDRLCRVDENSIRSSHANV